MSLHCCYCGGANRDANSEVLPELRKSTNSPFSDTKGLDSLLAEARTGDSKTPEQTADCTVKLHRPSPQDPLGMHVELSPQLGCFVVLKLRSDVVGAAQEHNILVPSDERICEGDFVMSVNGSSDVDEMVKAFEKDTEMELTIRRPRVFTVTVPKDGKPLGVKLKLFEAGKAMFIAAVEANGAVKAAGADVLAGDRIVSVNGQDSVEDMVEELKTSESLEMVLARI
mmetsp:Transcript_118291/g.328795  ORF Transcript_118291/g.328795 Transcript_118291/m.328795 type:complete len:226 (-) Transcript_118291:339-1016(-)